MHPYRHSDLLLGDRLLLGNAFNPMGSEGGEGGHHCFSTNFQRLGGGLRFTPGSRCKSIPNVSVCLSVFLFSLSRSCSLSLAYSLPPRPNVKAQPDLPCLSAFPSLHHCRAWDYLAKRNELGWHLPEPVGLRRTNKRALPLWPGVVLTTSQSILFLPFNIWVTDSEESSLY